MLPLDIRNTFPLFSWNIKRNQNAKQVEIPEDLMKLG